MRILTIFTGGTIACTNKNGMLSPDGDSGYLLLERYKELDHSVSFDVRQPYSILSENLDEEHLNALYDCLRGCGLSAYDGVIVAHGTDTLQYTGAFLSLRLGLCETPVALVSANFPLSDPRSNGFENFCAAVGFIRSHQGRGVFIVYKNKGENKTAVHRAVRVLPHLPYSDELFSLHGQPYGYIRGDVFEMNPDYREDGSEFVTTDEPFGKPVMYIRPYVGMIYPELTNGYGAVLLEGYHSGTLRTAGGELKAFCEKAKELGIPVYLTGSEEGFEYESKSAFGELGINVLPPTSPITAYMGCRFATMNTEN